MKTPSIARTYVLSLLAGSLSLASLPVVGCANHDSEVKGVQTPPILAVPANALAREPAVQGALSADAPPPATAVAPPPVAAAPAMSSPAASAPARSKVASVAATASPAAPPAPPSGKGGSGTGMGKDDDGMLAALSAGAGSASTPRSEVSGSGSDREHKPAELLRAPPPSYAPAASIAAGEWDDNANYREYQKWLATETGLPFRAVDVSHRRFLVVRDESGRAVPGCTVDVRDAGNRTVSLTTGPSGRAILFPNAEGLGQGLVTATAACAGGGVTRSISLAAADGVVDLRLPVARTLAQERTIDVAFILDTTGSMSEEIASVKATIAKVASGLGEGNVKVRIGLVEFKDRGDAFVTRVHPFATDVRGFAASVADINAGGGGDTPESVNEGIHVALTRLDWKAGSVGRFAFLVGDAPPHLDYQQDFSYADDMKTAAHRGIQLFTIAASGMDPLGQVVWRQIAQYTNAANMFVLRGGAGPQSTGAGDPRSSCGGTQKNYSSGNLDALILGKIDDELAAIDADPLRIAGLGEDENTKPCDQRVVMRDAVRVR